MKLQQLRYIVAVADSNLNVTQAASLLFTSQPGVSKQIRALEESLGLPIFERNGKHLTAITPEGEHILVEARDILERCDNIQRFAADQKNDTTGTIVIGTTHTQARYALPNAIRQFRERYPGVTLQIRQGEPREIARWASRGEVDFAIATEAMHLFQDLVMMPCYHWNRCVLVPPKHPLTQEGPLSLKRLSEHPIITYVFGFTGRSKLDDAFKTQQLEPNIVLTAVDADVIKTYVKLGLGIGIVANMAYDTKQDQDLVALDASHLFTTSTTNIGFRRSAWLRSYMYDFIEIFAPHLTNEVVEHCIAAETIERRQRVLQNVIDDLPTY